MTKIPPGVYSVENGKLHHSEGKYRLLDFIEGPAVTGMTIATIGFSLPGVHQLEVRERSAEEFLKESFIKNVQSRWPGVEWEAANGKDGSGYQWVYEAMHAFRSQPIAPVSEEEIEKKLKAELKRESELFASDQVFDPKKFRQVLAKVGEQMAIFAFNKTKEAYKAALSRTQSGYTREQMEEAEVSELNGFNLYPHSQGCLKVLTENGEGAILDAQDISRLVFLLNRYLNSLTPSITSVTIGEENNIIDIKYK